MTVQIDRRRLLRLAGLGGGAVVASALVDLPGLAGAAHAAGKAAPEDFFFVQLTDTHWGYSGAANPESASTLKRAVAAVNALDPQPDFIVFTGDLTHTTDDDKERRRRMAEFRDIVSGLRTKQIRFLAGEHDAALDRGAAYQEFFGKPNYTFDHKGFHFIAIDNVSDPDGKIGEAQLKWLAGDLAQLDKDTPIIVLTHRPLFDLAADWDWFTKDATQATDLLKPFANVSVFYGHIHQEHHHVDGNIAHHAATSLIFPLPAPRSQPKRAPVAWDPAAPFKGLGWRKVDVAGKKTPVVVTPREEPLKA